MAEVVRQVRTLQAQHARSVVTEIVSALGSLMRDGEPSPEMNLSGHVELNAWRCGIGQARRVIGELLGDDLMPAAARKDPRDQP
jgi:hypothetical protein